MPAQRRTPQDRRPKATAKVAPGRLEDFTWTSPRGAVITLPNAGELEAGAFRRASRNGDEASSMFVLLEWAVRRELEDERESVHVPTAEQPEPAPVTDDDVSARLAAVDRLRLPELTALFRDWIEHGKAALPGESSGSSD